MRKILILALLVTTAFGVYSEGKAEKSVGEPIILRVFASGDPVTNVSSMDIWTMIDAVFKTEYPNVVVEHTAVDLSTGADITMRTEVAAGTPPDIYWDFWGRLGSYIRPGFALDLSKYHDDLDDYLPGVVDAVTREGQVLALQTTGSAQAIVLNMTIIEEVGFTCDWDNWTMADFDRLGRLVKQHYGGKVWLTGLFAGNQSGDYLMRNWAASFGANFYADGDYSKTALNNQAGLDTLAFFKTLTDRGYVRQDWPTQVDDDYAIDWAQSRLAATPWFPGWSAHYMNQAVEQGFDAFEVKFVPFPKAEGVDIAGVYWSNHGIVVVKSDDEERNEIAARYAWYMNSPEAQLMLTMGGAALPNRLSLAADKAQAEVQAVMAVNGTYDLGLTTQYFTPTRPLFPQALQKLMAGTAPQAVLDWYAVEVARVAEEVDAAQ